MAMKLSYVWVGILWMDLLWNEPGSYRLGCGSLLHTELPHHMCLDRGSYTFGYCMPYSDHIQSSLCTLAYMLEDCLWSQVHKSIQLVHWFHDTDCLGHKATDYMAVWSQVLYWKKNGHRS